jgi:hypothetical protein
MVGYDKQWFNYLIIVKRNCHQKWLLKPFTGVIATSFWGYILIVIRYYS